MDELLTTEDVAEYLKMSKKTISGWRYAEQPKGPKFLRLSDTGNGGKPAIRYRKSDVDAWLQKSNEPQGTQQQDGGL